MQGPTEVVTRFIDEPSPYRHVISMTIHDALQIAPEERARLIDRWPALEREARALGKPMLGAGAIFTAPEDSITEMPIEHIPEHWVKLWGIDFGIGHPFAAVLILWDRDNDVIHAYLHLPGQGCPADLSRARGGHEGSWSRRAGGLAERRQCPQG